MKRIISLVLAVIMIASLAAVFSSCGEDNKLVMATNAQFPPYEYYEGQKIVGIDAEIAALIAEKLGMTLEIADIEFDSIISGVQTGKYTMGMAGMTVTEDRLKNVNFSESYATGVQVVIVTEDSPIKSVDDLGAEGATYKIGVQIATTGSIYAKDDYGEDRVVNYNNGAEAVEALKTGRVDCVIIDNEPAKAFVKANTGLAILETEYVVENYAIALNKNDTELLEKINKALKELKDAGKIDEIINKYIK